MHSLKLTWLATALAFCAVVHGQRLTLSVHASWLDLELGAPSLGVKGYLTTSAYVAQIVLSPSSGLEVGPSISLMRLGPAGSSLRSNFGAVGLYTGGYVDYKSLKFSLAVNAARVLQRDTEFDVGLGRGGNPFLRKYQYGLLPQVYYRATLSGGVDLAIGPHARILLNELTTGMCGFGYGISGQLTMR